MDGCSFMPQVNKKKKAFEKNPELKERFKEEADAQKVFSILYEKRKNRQPQKDKQTLEVEYEK